MYVEQHPDSIVLYCEKYIDHSNLNENYQLLKNLISFKKKIEIEAGQIERINTAGIQLLLNFIRQLEKDQLEVRWNSISTVLLIVAKYLGATKQLKLLELEQS